MKIGITCYPTQGGSGIVATELGSALAERGHEVHFVSYARPLRLDDSRPNLFFHPVTAPEYPVFQFPPWTIAAASRMVQVIDDFSLDVLHVHYAIPHAIAALLAKQMVGCERIRIITTLHGTDITLVGQEEAYYKPTCFALNHSDGITTVSDYLARETERVFGVPQTRMRVIPNFIDRVRFAPMPDQPRRLLRHKWGATDEFVMMHLSNFRPVKRTPDVIELFAKVRERVPAKLVLIGDGPDLPGCVALAERLGVGDSVISLGSQTDVWQLLPAADLYLLTSEQESFGLSALEAMACGVPIITTNAGGLPEVNVDRHTGFICGVGDVTAMASRAVELALDPTLRTEMSQAARARSAVFEDHAIVTAYENYYRHVAQLDSCPDIPAAVTTTVEPATVPR